MTDRHSGYVVVLDHDMREDDAEAILNAIRMIKGVATVEPVVSSLLDGQIAEGRRDRLWQEALSRLIRYGPSGAAP